MDGGIDRLERAVRKLTNATWALVAFTAATLVWSVVSVWLYAHTSIVSTKSSGADEHFPTEFRKYSDFHKLPLEEQLKQASAIVIAKHEVQDGRLIAKVSEIPCLKPGTRLSYKVGDELRDSGRRIEPNTMYGDGQFVLFTGKDADFRFSATYTNNRLYMAGNMSLDEFRAEVTKACK
jgi:hypothetical protein